MNGKNFLAYTNPLIVPLAAGALVGVVLKRIFVDFLDGIIEDLKKVVE